MSEAWRSVSAMPWSLSSYEVSDLGQMRRGQRTLAGHLNAKGYVQLTLTDDHGNKRSTRLHRVVAATFLGPCPDGQMVRHLDGDPQNNRLSNLAYGTAAENEADKFLHGTRPAAATQTQCVNGHEFTAENTRHSRRGDGIRRVCRECANAACRASRAQASA